MFTASKRTLITALAVTAAAAPSTASARFLEADPVSGPAPAAAAVSHPAPSSQPSSSAFEWGDAGIGAAAAVALLGAGTAALGGRRRRGQPARMG
jgi:hypothetical protein